MTDQDLSAFRAKETPAAAMIALADPGLSLLLALWSTVKVRIAPSETVPATWAELWSDDRAAVDISEVATMLGVDVNTAARVVERAIALRVVYPDGTIHESARELLGKKVELWKRLALGQKAEIPDSLPEPEPEQ